MRKRVIEILAVLAFGALVLGATAVWAAAYEEEPAAPKGGQRESAREAQPPAPRPGQREAVSPEAEGERTRGAAPGSRGMARPGEARRESESPEVRVPPGERGKREAVVVEPKGPAPVVIEPEFGTRQVVVEPPRPVQVEPPRYYRGYGFLADIWTDQRVYRVGDRMRVYFRVTEPSYVYIYNTDTLGRTHQIFPNFFDRDNFVQPGRRYYIPAPTDDYNLRIIGPPGHEEMRIVAVRKRPIYYERGLEYDAESPYPRYEPGAEGLLDMYREREGLPTPRESVRRGDEVRAEPTRPGRAPRGGQREAVVVEPKGPPPSTIVVEEPRTAQVVVEPVDEREYAESYTTVLVVSDYARVPVYYGQLDIDSRPSGASVYIDGIFRGITPVLIRYMEPGVHTVTLDRSGFYAWEGDVSIREGRQSSIDVRLAPRRGRWSFDFRW